MTEMVGMYGNGINSDSAKNNGLEELALGFKKTLRNGKFLLLGTTLSILGSCTFINNTLDKIDQKMREARMYDKTMQVYEEFPGQKVLAGNDTIEVDIKIVSYDLDISDLNKINRYDQIYIRLARENSNEPWRAAYLIGDCNDYYAHGRKPILPIEGKVNWISAELMRISDIFSEVKDSEQLFAQVNEIYQKYSIKALEKEIDAKYNRIMELEE
ncbi:MAG: hypothetical protein ACP5N3_05280 [Candidatus Nanoarchaeia archaeon]